MIAGATLAVGHEVPTLLPARRPGAVRRASRDRRLWGALLLAGLGLAGCRSSTTTIDADDPQVAAYLSLMLPRKIEVQRYLTQPRSLEGGGNTDGVEAIVSLKDALDDDVKCVGTFNFELYTLRLASGDRFGERIALWSIKVDSEAALRDFWDRVSHFYTFRLKLENPPLPPGRYILTAQFAPPIGDKLFDEYRFEHQTGTATP